MSNQLTSAGFAGRKKRNVLRSGKGAVCPHCDTVNAPSVDLVHDAAKWCISCKLPFSVERIETLNGTEWLTVPWFIVEEDGSVSPN